MSEEDLERWLPKQAVLDLLEDIDNFVQPRTELNKEIDVASKREALQDHTKIVTMDTLIFLKGLLTWSWRKKMQLPDPWLKIHAKLDSLVGILWLHVAWSGLSLYQGQNQYFNDTRSGMKRDLGTNQFEYRKLVVPVSTDLVLSGPGTTDAPCGVMLDHVNVNSESMSTMLFHLNHLSAFEDAEHMQTWRAREAKELREREERTVVKEQIRQRDDSGIEKQTLLPLVQQLAYQLDCGTKRLAGERADWHAGPVQPSAGGDALINILAEILTILRANGLPNITATNMELIKPKLASIRYNIYLDYWYHAASKTMEKSEHDYSLEDYPKYADWAPAIALFKIEHPTLRWEQLWTLYRNICRICDVDWRQ